MNSYLRDVIAAVRAIPDQIADGLDRWLLRRHAPVDIYGDGSECACRACKVKWPCSDFIDASERVDSRRSRQS